MREHDLLAEHERDCERRALQRSSIIKRMSILRRVTVELDKPLRSISFTELRDWTDRLKIGPKSKYTYLSHLHAFYEWAIREGLLEVDPTVRIVRPKLRPGLPRPIATVDLEHLIASATLEVSAMVHLAAFAGLRCMEIAALDAPEIMFTAEPPAVLVLNGKGGRSRVVPMGATLIEALRGHGVPHFGPVFRRDNGDRYPAYTISHILRTHIHACGVQASGHQLRHAFATAVYRSSGGDLRMTQELLGHASPSTTAIYAAWSQERAAEVVDGLYRRAN